MVDNQVDFAGFLRDVFLVWGAMPHACTHGEGKLFENHLRVMARCRGRLDRCRR